MSILGNRIKKERENLELTREELAQKIGVSYSAIAMYEQGNREPNNELLLKMCEIFNCSVDYLMGKSKIKNEINIDIPKMLSKYKNYIQENNMPKIEYNILTDNEKNILFEMFANFANKVNGKSNLNPLSYYKNQVKDDLHWNSIFGIYIIYIKYVYDIFSEINTKFSDNFTNNTGISFNKKNIDNNIPIEESKFYMCPVYGQISAGQPNWAEECIEGRLPIDPNMMNIVDPEECFFLRVNGESMNKLVRNGSYALIRKTDWVENGEIAVVLVNGFDATLKKFSKQGDLVVLEPMSNDSSFQVQIYDKNTPIKILGKYIGKFEMK